MWLLVVDHSMLMTSPLHRALVQIYPTQGENWDNDHWAVRPFFEQLPSEGARRARRTGKPVPPKRGRINQVGRDP
jgi:hypothetical protein